MNLAETSKQAFSKAEFACGYLHEFHVLCGACLGGTKGLGVSVLFHSTTQVVLVCTKGDGTFFGFCLLVLFLFWNAPPTSLRVGYS